MTGLLGEECSDPLPMATTGTRSMFLHEGCWASQVVLVVKNPAANAGDIRDVRSIPGLGTSPGEGNGNPLQYSGLENPMDRGAWRATVHGVVKAPVRSLGREDLLGKKMATHSSILAWRIPWSEEPGGLHSMG